MNADRIAELRSMAWGLPRKSHEDAVNELIDEMLKARALAECYHHLYVTSAYDKANVLELPWKGA